MHCEKPTLIQEKSLTSAFGGHDVLGAAPTGSGKTLAFCIPAVDWLLKHPEEEEKEEEEEGVEEEEDVEEEGEGVEEEDVEEEEEEEEEDKSDVSPTNESDSEVIIESESESESENDDDVEENEEEEVPQVKTSRRHGARIWNVKCMIITPTRELALQINRVLTRLTEHTSIR